MSLIDKQLTGQTPRAGTMSHGITAGGVARPLLVNDDGTVNVTGGGGGTEYTEGATDTTITGSAMMWEDTGDTLRAVSASKPLPVSFTGGGDASAANQTTIIGHVDGIETLLGTIDTDTGGIATSTASIDTKTPALGQALAAASVPVILPSATITTLTPPAAITGFATSAKQDTLLTELQLKADLTETQPVSMADGANVTLGAKTDAKSTATDATSVTAMQVLKQISASVQAPPTQAVTFTNSTDVATETTLALIKAKTDNIPAQGQALAAASLPVVLTAAQITTLTPPAAITGFATSAKQDTLDTSINTLLKPASTLAAVTTVTTVSTLTGGGIAHDGADSGNPIKVGARAVSAEIAAVANNDRSDLLTTLTGKLIVATNTNPENIVSGVTSAMTGTTSTSVVAAPASGLRNYITQITVGNSHATVGTFVNIQDGSGGTTIWTIPAAAVYGGATINFDPPLRQPTTATAIYCACVTTGSNTIVAANGFKAA